MKKILAATTLALAFAMPQAEASLFNFSYTYGIHTLAGTVEGTLQPDNNSVIVSSVEDFVTYNGNPIGSLPWVHSLDFVNTLTASDFPLLSLDGSKMDFIACDSVTCTQSFSFAVGTNLSDSYGRPLFGASSDLGIREGYEDFDSANWDMEAIPTPATLPLFAIGAATLAFRRRKTI
jgi:hypothetical protein